MALFSISTSSAQETCRFSSGRNEQNRQSATNQATAHSEKEPPTPVQAHGSEEESENGHGDAMLDATYQGHGYLQQVQPSPPSARNLQSDDNPQFKNKGKISLELAEAMGCSVSDRQLYFTRRARLLELAEVKFDLKNRAWSQKPENAENEMLADLAVHFPDAYGETVSDLDRERRFAILCKYIQRYKHTKFKGVRSTSRRGYKRGRGGKTLGRGRGRARSNRTRLDSEDSDYVPLLSYPFDDQKKVEENAPSVEPLPVSSIKSPEDIRQFLQSCNPPLTHLIEPLLAAGCANKDFLSAVASWEIPAIMEFLKEDVTLGSGRPIPPLEARILARQLKTALSSLNIAAQVV